MVYANCIRKVKCPLNGDQGSQGHLLIGFAFLLVVPFQHFFPLCVCHVSVLNYLTHLCVQKCVSYHHLFVLKISGKSFTLERKVVKVETERTKPSIA
jgi:hypothetical protein